MNYNSNNHQEENNEPRVKAVAKGEEVKEKGLNRFANGLFSGDIRSVCGYVIDEVLKPSLKKLIYDVVTNGTHMALYEGKAAPANGTRVQYNNKYSSSVYSSSGRSQVLTSSPKSGIIKLPSRDKAVDVHSELMCLVDAGYDTISLKDLYDAAEITCDYTYNKWGWRAEDIIHARVVPLDDGWTLKLPRPLPIQ